MLTIETARGLPILADKGDADLLAGYSWYAQPHGERFYAYARDPNVTPDMPRSRISMHRLLMRPPNGMVVHHLNNNGLDNRRSNLMIVTPRDNLLAHYRQRRTGVHFHKQTGKWRAQSREEGGMVSLGLFHDKEEAYAAVARFREATI